MNKTAILSWFTGKALTEAQHALGLLEQSLELGSWIPGASRRCHSAMSKSNVAKKFAKANEEAYRAIGATETNRYSTPGWSMWFMLFFGSVFDSRNANFAEVRKNLPLDGSSKLVDYAELYLKDMTPVADAMAMLDATRPIPVFTKLGVSPTITKTLEGIFGRGMDFKMDKIYVCPSHLEKLESVDDKGQTVYRFVMVLDWPANTVFRASRFANTGSADQCHSCGHAIRNPFNWVPILAEDTLGTPHALWVGRDCAKNLFEIKAEGELEYVNAHR